MNKPKTTKKTDITWIRRELNKAVTTPSASQEELLWTPLDAAMISRSYMVETHGGGRIESVPGLNRRRAVTAGLSIGQPHGASDMLAQSAIENRSTAPSEADATSVDALVIGHRNIASS